MIIQLGTYLCIYLNTYIKSDPQQKVDIVFPG